MRVLLDTELWLVAPENPEDDLPLLIAPLVTNQRGEGTPGVVSGVLRVFKPGMIVEFEVHERVSDGRQ